MILFKPTLMCVNHGKGFHLTQEVSYTYFPRVREALESIKSLFCNLAYGLLNSLNERSCYFGHDAYVELKAKNSDKYSRVEISPISHYGTRKKIESLMRTWNPQYKISSIPLIKFSRH